MTDEPKDEWLDRMRAECKRRTALNWDEEYDDLTESCRGEEPSEVMDRIIKKYDLSDLTAHDYWG